MFNMACKFMSIREGTICLYIHNSEQGETSYCLDYNELIVGWFNSFYWSM